jgi:hypothetical protein
MGFTVGCFQCKKKGGVQGESVMVKEKIVKNLNGE